MNIEELKNWSGWRLSDKPWIDAISACIKNSLVLHNILSRVKRERIEAARKGKSNGFGFVGLPHRRARGDHPLNDPDDEGDRIDDEEYE